MLITALRNLMTLAPIVLSATVAGCGSADDDAASGDAPELTDVDPYAAVPVEEPPGLDEAGDEESAGEHAIDPRGPGEEDIAPAEVNLYADAVIDPAASGAVTGSLRFHQDGDVMRITGALKGLDPGRHGLHVHAVGDCSAPDAASAKGHFAPDGDPHGSPERPNDLHHVGDLGNITADENGVAEVDKADTEMTLEAGDYTVLNRAVIVHAQPDDLTSQPSGDAGDRIGCGVVILDAAPAYTGA